MSSFDQFHDTPKQIINEGEQITVSLKRTNSTGIVSWNIPKSTGGCDSLSIYNGALITIDTTPTAIEKFPIDGRKYVADPTANPELHLGDKIGTALVVGYVDNTTTQLTVSDLNTEIPYYISLHAISNVQTYHQSGVHSYSLPITGLKTPNTSAFHKIRVGGSGVGVSLSDPTNLDPTKTYDLPIITDYDKKYALTFDAATIQTYGALIDQINLQAMLIDAPLQSPIIPNSGMYYYIANTYECFLWNGTQLIPKKVLVKDSAPSIIVANQYWYNPETKTLYVSNSLGIWTPVSFITRSTDPLDIDCGYYWYKTNENKLYLWNGTVWLDTTLLIQTTDPILQFKLDCNSYWFDENKSELYKLSKCCSKWVNVLAMYSPTNPHTPTINDLWFDDKDQQLFKWDGVNYIGQVVLINETLPSNLLPGQYWYKPSTMILVERIDLATTIEVDYLIWDSNPTIPVVGSLWWNSTNDTLHQWDGLTDTWIQIEHFYIDNQDPLTYTLDVGVVWTVDNVVYKKWDGSEWLVIQVTNLNVDPHNMALGTIWFDGVIFKQLISGNVWTNLQLITQEHNPYIPIIDDFWYDSNDDILYRFNGSNWINVNYSPSNLKPGKGYTYFDTTLNKLRTWNGYGWIDGEAKFTARLSDDGQYIILETSLTGSYARIETPYTNNVVAGTYQQALGSVPAIFADMIPSAYPLIPVKGGDGLQGNPSYMQTGVGTDGTVDERRDLIDSTRYQLGYPTVEVELTKQQIGLAIDNAFDTLRMRSGMAYKRGFYFLQIVPGQQKYLMTDRKIGYNKITSVLKIHRVTSAFLSNPEGQGVYGQMALQNLYNMGSFDLISYHLVSQYIETMEQLFATNVMFDWNEDIRTLSIFKQFYKPERVLMEVTVERTEQDMLKDRYLKFWIERYTLCQCRIMLAEVRGKYGSLPGSGGGVTLNANELTARADTDMIELLDQIDNYIINNPEEYGNQFVLG